MIAAIFAYQLAKRAKIRRGYLLFLTFALALVGIGSFIFHAIPSHATVLLDAVPIYIFIVSAVVFLLERLTNSWRIAVAAVAAFVSIEIIASALVPTTS